MNITLTPAKLLIGAGALGIGALVLAACTKAPEKVEPTTVGTAEGNRIFDGYVKAGSHPEWESVSTTNGDKTTTTTRQVTAIDWKHSIEESKTPGSYPAILGDVVGTANTVSGLQSAVDGERQLSTATLITREGTDYVAHYIKAGDLWDIDKFTPNDAPRDIVAVIDANKVAYMDPQESTDVRDAVNQLLKTE